MARTAASPTESRRGRYFHFGSALVMIALALIGFAPTFYLRDIVPAPVPHGPPPGYLLAQGFAMTAWCLFFVWQTWLSATGRIASHRRARWWCCSLLALAVLKPVHATAVATFIESANPMKNF